MNTTYDKKEEKLPDDKKNYAPARELKLKYSRGVGRAMLLTGISALAVSLLVVIFSGIGGTAAFRLGVRAKTCEVDTSDNARLEYYAARPALTGVTSCRFYLRDGDRTSVSAAVDFLAFLKQQDVALDTVRIDSGDEEAIAAYLSGDGDPEGIDAAALDLADDALKSGGICVETAAEGLHLAGRRAVKAHAVAVIGRADLEPEHRPFEKDAAVLYREPQMILVRPAPEQPPRVAVNARDVQTAVHLREAAAHQRLRLGGERLERLVHGLLKLLLVLVEPDALVIECQLPEKISGSGSKSVKHDVCSFLLFILKIY